ncbi:MAG: hypothetical protein PVJ28_01815 [Acidimicrobiia bacterium]|jgi:hypothetical protein
MGRPAISPQPLANWLERQIERAARAMSQELGEDSVCTVHKDGRVTGGLKYQEGRMSALAGMRRALERGELEPSVLASAEVQWSAEFETRRTASTSSPLWVSYATGGLDAVREARNRQQQPTPE